MLRHAIAGIVWVVAVVALCNAPLLERLWAILQLDDLANSADAPTHYLRMLHARDLYLPSGHHWGWDPFWFQGFVPFLLYPHLAYVVLALASIGLSLDPIRLFNAFTVAIYLALPLIAAIPLIRARGLAAATLMAVWMAHLSSVYGAGARGVFGLGLLSQQLGLCLFAVFSYDLLIARRTDRAAIWLGIAPLIHIHTALIAGLAWLGTGLQALARLRNDRTQLVGWCVGSLLAAVIALPTITGLVVGHENFGAGTMFPRPGDMLGLLYKGLLVGPWPAAVAIAAGAVGGAVFARTDSRRSAVSALAVGVGLLVIALQTWSVDTDTLNRLLRSVLPLRTLPFAFIWLAFVAVAGWHRLPPALKRSIAALTACTLVLGWSAGTGVARRMGTPFRHGAAVEPRTLGEYRHALEWIRDDVGAETTTVALVFPPRTTRGSLLRRLLETVEQPLISGHGIELTAVRNSMLATKPEKLDCKELRSDVDDYVVGYILGASNEERRIYERCLGHGPALVEGTWWVFATGKRWHAMSPAVYGFSHNATWTELRWYAPPASSPVTLRLPVAHTAPWTAEADGEPIVIDTTHDHMMSVSLPAGTERLRLRYRGFAGEWASVLLGALGLSIALLRARRSSRRA